MYISFPYIVFARNSLSYKDDKKKLNINHIKKRDDSFQQQ